MSLASRSTHMQPTTHVIHKPPWAYNAQVVVALYSPLIGKTPREARFRTKFDAAIVAVQRR
eukprot:scaffold295107_cov22-Tisochrysis_lutea.AAC.1